MVEGALADKHQNTIKNRKKNKKNFEENRASSSSALPKEHIRNQNKFYPPCQHRGKKTHPSFRCWKRPDAKCSKYNHFGHEAVICKDKAHQQEAEAQVADHEDEDQIFTASFHASINSSQSQSYYS